MRDALAFAGVAAVVILIPGPDMALVLRNGLAHGRRSALETAVGISVGLLIWAVASALGIAALLEASGSALAALKLAGAAYLVFLGVRALRDAWRGGSSLPGADVSVRGLERAPSAFRQGLLSNALNPKIALVFTTLIPQFVGPGDPVVARTILLAAIFIAMGLVWLTSYALLVAQVGGLLRAPVVQRALNAVVGALLTAFGVRLALERR